jgi:hypothetical protein
MPDCIFKRVIWSNHHGKKIIEAKRRHHIEPTIVFEPDADRMNDRGVALNRFIGRI